MVLLPSRARDATSAATSASGRTLVLTGASAAVWAAVAGMLVGTVLAIATWAVEDATGADAASAARFGLLLWLLGHHVGIAVPGGYVGLVPLGLALPPLVAAAWILRSVMYGYAGRVRTSRSLLWLYAGFVAGYALLTTAVAATAGLAGPGRPVWWQALLGGAVLAAVGGGAGAWRFLREPAAALSGAALARVDARRWVPWATAGRIRAALRAGAAATATAVAGGSLVVAVALAGTGQRAGPVVEALTGGGTWAAVPLLLASVAMLPNSAIYAIAYGTGPGFAIGAGTSVSPLGVDLEGVPAFPLLAALPIGPAPLAMNVLAVAVPIVAGMVGGCLLLVVRPLARPSRAVAGGLAVGLVAGAAVAVLSAIAGGPVLAGRLATIGPAAGPTGLAAAVEIGVFAALTAGCASALRRLRTRRSGADTR